MIKAIKDVREKWKVEAKEKKEWKPKLSKKRKKPKPKFIKKRTKLKLKLVKKIKIVKIKAIAWKKIEDRIAEKYGSFLVDKINYQM